MYLLKYILVLLLYSCSYSVHDNGLREQQRYMLKHDNKSRKEIQKLRSKNQIKNKKYRFNRKNKYI